ncbi:response regulator transcription factor [Pseudonocardia adelaidensis]|uniref:Response regulator transcription factor n=1 Tax=Pseudonocardia adelaidensis TaxID=648754 RepID=A0ABP9NWX9_9PSEU
MTTILVAEDTAILRDSLVVVLDLEPDLEVVAAVGTGDAIVPAALHHRPDVAVLDIDLPGTDGLTAAAHLREQLPDCRVLILTALARPGNLRTALANHASGFLGKDAPARTLVDAVRQIAAGGRVVDPALAVATLTTRPNPLTEREAEVLRLFARGTGPREIASDLFLTVGTVRNYLASATVKLGARNRVDGIRIATEMGWI